MAPRLLRCAIEEVADWQAHLYAEPYADGRRVRRFGYNKRRAI